MNQVGGELKLDLDALVREGARRMLLTALKAEVDEYVSQHAGMRDEAQAAANKLGIQLRLNRRADELRNEFGRLISPSGDLCRSSFKR